MHIICFGITTYIRGDPPGQINELEARINRVGCCVSWLSMDWKEEEPDQ